VGAWDTQGLPLQPASQPLVRILPPWLANTCNPAMSPIPSTCHTDETVEGRKINGWEEGGKDAK